MPHKTSDKVFADLVDQLGEEFATDLYNLQNSYFQVRYTWRFYRSLFGTNPELVEVLNAVSGIFFYTLEKSFFETVVLGLCRLLDPAVTGRGSGAKDNMTFLRLRDHLRDDLKSDYDKLIEEATNAATFARDHRNRAIAHSDYEIGSGADKLLPATRKAIQELLDATGKLVQFVHLRYFDTDYALDVLLPVEDEKRFLRILHMGLETEKEDQKNFEEAIERKDYDAANFVRGDPEWLKD